MEPTGDPGLAAPHSLSPDLHKWGTLPGERREDTSPELPGVGAGRDGEEHVFPFGRGPGPRAAESLAGEPVLEWELEEGRGTGLGRRGMRFGEEKGRAAG